MAVGGRLASLMLVLLVSGQLGNRMVRAALPAVQDVQACQHNCIICISHDYLISCDV